MSSDYKITKIMVNLCVDPYSPEAIDTIDGINTCIENNVKHSTLKNTKFGIDGVSSTNRDSKIVSTGDLSRIKLIMLRYRIIFSIHYKVSFNIVTHY